MIKPLIFLGVFCLTAFGCKPSGPPSPVTNSNTNWLKVCDESADCGEEDACICNVCTTFCEQASDCGESKEGAVCVVTQEGAAGTICSAEEPQEAICLPGCVSEADCGDGFDCSAEGVCLPQPEELTPTCETCHAQRFDECINIGLDDVECRRSALAICHENCTTQECVEKTQGACAELGGDEDECRQESEQLCLGARDEDCFSDAFLQCSEENPNENECGEIARAQCDEVGCAEQAFSSCIALGHSEQECQESARLQCEPNQNDEDDCFERFNAECNASAIDPGLCEGYFQRVCEEQNGDLQVEECVQELFVGCAEEGENEEACLQQGEDICQGFQNL